MDRGREPAGSLLTQRLLDVRQVRANPRSRVEYHVCDEHGRPLATAAYLPKEEVAAVLDTYGLRPWTAAVLRIVDGDGRALLTVAFPGMRGRAVMLVRDGAGEHLGEAVKTKGYVKVRYELRHGGRLIGAIQVEDWRERGARVEDAHGASVASIRTTGEGYRVVIERPLAEPLRSLLFACCVALQAAIGEESRPGTYVEDGGGTTIVRMAVLPPILDRLRRKTARIETAR